MLFAHLILTTYFLLKFIKKTYEKCNVNFEIASRYWGDVFEENLYITLDLVTLYNYGSVGDG